MRMHMILVADIGGTNARLGLFSGDELSDEQVYKCADFGSIEELLESYLSSLTAFPTKAAIAVACVAHGDCIKFTNSSWRFSVAKVAKQFNFIEVKVLNDFAALALSIPFLGSKQLIKLGGGEIIEGNAKAVVGAGTGLGVSGLLPNKNSWIPIQGEGGHVRYGAYDDHEYQLFKILAPNDQYVSAEKLLNGRGLVRLYNAKAKLNGQPALYGDPPGIVSQALSGSDSLCVETLTLYCGILGDVAGDIALLLGARGGLYIGGGVVGHIQPFLLSNETFRQRFQDKGAQAKMVEQIPAFIIQEPLAGLYGAAGAADKAFQSIGVNYINGDHQHLTLINRTNKFTTHNQRGK